MGASVEPVASGDVEQRVRLGVDPGSGKRLVRVFLSFAAADRACAARLWDGLQVATAVDRSYRFVLWRFDQAIVAGEAWDSRIRSALVESEIGILAMSDAFLASRYIRETEIPALAHAEGKRCLPVALSSWSRHADQAGLAGLQIYGYQRPFELERGAVAQRQWVHGLVDQLHRVLDEYGDRC